MDIEGLVSNYIRLRDKKQAIEKDQKAVIAEYNTALKAIEERLMVVFNESNIDSTKTKAGTAYKTILSSVKVEDPALFRDFIEANNAWSILDARASKSAVEQWLEENGAPPPGVSINRIAKINVKRS